MVAEMEKLERRWARRLAKVREEMKAKDADAEAGFCDSGGYALLEEQKATLGKCIAELRQVIRRARRSA